MVKLSRIMNSPDAVKALATSDENGEPHVVYEDFMIALDDETIAIADILETSQKHSNMLASMWFNKDIAINVLSPKEHISIEIRGKVLKYIFTSDNSIFQQFYKAIYEKLHASCTGVWLVRPETITEMSLMKQIKREYEARGRFFHQYLEHYFTKEKCRHRCIKVHKNGKRMDPLESDR